MLPALDQNGLLPPGIHPATIEEVEERFGRSSEIRRAQMDSLRWLLPLCRAAEVRRLVINGSFVTDVPEPNDVDCILLQGPGYNPAWPAALELEQGLPFLSLQIVRQPAFDYLAVTFFGTDRAGAAKGVVEVAL